MHNPEISNKIFIGVVEKNDDPKRLGRVKVRIPLYYDEIDTDSIPWARPWKDLNGNEFSAPDVGKIVSVVFDQGNPYMPEYIFSEHYNTNLEKKLKELSNSDYPSFKAVLFDHSTQIYRSESEGLKIDHEYSNINLRKNGNININLKDNSTKLNLGSPDPDQRVVLGDNFMKWMDQFIEALVVPGSGYLTSVPGAPVGVAGPLAEAYTSYQSLRQSKFLSKHVRVPENDKIKEQRRSYENQKGDKWSTTKKTNRKK